MRVIIVDNFDSFTYNLVQALLVLGAEVTVYRNNGITPRALLDQRPDRVLISPGPGGPQDAGISLALIAAAAGHVPLLGVCLGHQCLAEVFGGRIVRVAPVHGKTSRVQHDNTGLMRGLPSPFSAARYHSLAVDPGVLPDDLRVNARTPDGVIMGVQHRALPLAGVQFHPESFMSPNGPQLLGNFLKPEFATAAAPWDAPAAVRHGSPAA